MIAEKPSSLPLLLPTLCVAVGPLADRLLRHRGLSVLPRSAAVGLLVGVLCLISYAVVGRPRHATAADPSRPLVASLWAALAVATVVVILEAVGY